MYLFKLILFSAMNISHLVSKWNLDMIFDSNDNEISVTVSIFCPGNLKTDDTMKYLKTKVNSLTFLVTVID